MFCVLSIAGLAFVGGYLKIFDSSIFYQLTSKNLHHLEFDGEFKARQVENGYNRLPLLVVEGTIRDFFKDSEDVKKIQLKAFAYDSENRMIASHFTYAGNVLTDEQLEDLVLWILQQCVIRKVCQFLDLLDSKQFKKPV